MTRKFEIRNLKLVLSKVEGFEIPAGGGCNGFTPLDKATDFNRRSQIEADGGLKPGVREFCYLTGFTFIELLIVLVVIGIAALIAVPMMSSAASMQIRSATNIVAADLEYAKSMAISRGQNFSVVFDKTNEKYQIEDQDENVIPHPVKKGFDYIVDFRNDSRLGKVDIVDADFDDTIKIKFDYLGSPYNGNNNALIEEGVITLQAGGITKRIRVKPLTGYISITD